MSENKYVRMMRQQQQRCHRQALDWPRHSVTREGWEREVVEWQAAADAFEAMAERLRESTALLRLALPPAGVDTTRLFAANEAAMKKAEGE